MHASPLVVALGSLATLALTAPAHATEPDLPLQPGWELIEHDTTDADTIEVTWAADADTCADALADGAVDGSLVADGYRYAGRGRDAATGLWRITVAREGGALFTMTVAPVDAGCRVTIPRTGHALPATRWRLGPVRVYASGGVELIFDRLDPPR